MMIPASATIVLCIACMMIGYGLDALIDLFKPHTSHTN
jgi:hypothetical protein